MFFRNCVISVCASSPSTSQKSCTVTALTTRKTASARTLSRVLDDLEEMGFVERRLEEDAPVATYYSLIPKGELLCSVFEEIRAWTDEWFEVEGA